MFNFCAKASYERAFVLRDEKSMERFMDALMTVDCEVVRQFKSFKSDESEVIIIVSGPCDSVDLLDLRFALENLPYSKYYRKYD